MINFEGRKERIHVILLMKDIDDAA